MVTIRPGMRADLAAVVALETAADTAMWLGETGLRARALYASEGFGVVRGPVKTMTEPDGSTSELLVMVLPMA